MDIILCTTEKINPLKQLILFMRTGGKAPVIPAKCRRSYFIAEINNGKLL